MGFWFRSPDADATRSAARGLGGVAPPEGGLIVLIGPLGAGKTVFVQGLAAGLGLDPGGVASPTFVIASEYPAARPGLPSLVHADLYRLESADELDAAGWLDWLSPGRIVAAEWGDRFPDALPRERLEVRLTRDPGDPARRIAVRAHGEPAAAWATRWRSALAAGGVACHDDFPGAPAADRGARGGADRNPDSRAGTGTEAETESEWR